MEEMILELSPALHISDALRSKIEERLMEAWRKQIYQKAEQILRELNELKSEEPDCIGSPADEAELRRDGLTLIQKEYQYSGDARSYTQKEILIRDGTREVFLVRGKTLMVYAPGDWEEGFFALFALALQKRQEADKRTAKFHQEEQQKRDEAEATKWGL